jgi:PAS domain S-box-containing protein
VIFTGYTIVTACLIASIFFWNIFPVCYDETSGLTPFKKISEYIISGLLLVSAFLLFKEKDLFEPKIKIFLLISILLTVVSEIFFTLYRSVYGIHNLLGHYFKIISFYFVYYATIHTGLGKPFDLLLRSLKKNEEDLRRQKEFSESLIETARVIVLVLNREGKIIRVNKLAEDITGYQAEEIQGKSWTDIFLRPRDRASTNQMLQKAVEETDVYDTTNTVICKDGHTIEVEWFDKRLCDKNGNAIGLICVGHDVTEQRSIERQKEVLIGELQDALSRVKTLQKLLPICSKCKKIRDDEGYWNRIEEYFDKHADTQFSHGLCPDCAELLYPGLCDKKYRAQEKTSQ